MLLNSNEIQSKTLSQSAANWMHKNKILFKQRFSSVWACFQKLKQNDDNEEEDV